MKLNIFQRYEKKCKNSRDKGIENSFYTGFENLLDEDFQSKDNYIVLNNPKSKRKVGHPDFQVQQSEIPIINIEAKPPKYDVLSWLNNPTCNSDAERLSNQIHKYRSRVGMVILVTDFKTIWWIDTDMLDNDVTKPIPFLNEFSILDNELNLLPNSQKEWSRLINFLKLDVEKAKSGIMELLTNVMPHVKKLRDELSRILNGSCKKEELGLRKYLIEVRGDLQKTLFSDTKDDFKKQFIDLYTQLVVYGMFMAWLRYNKRARKRRDFTIDTVPNFLPNGSLLKNLFNGIQDNMTDRLYDAIFNPIQKWFNKTEYVDIASQLDELMNEFYSEFLEQYDKELKKDMGVVYTPEEVVDFMTRTIDYLLQTNFGIKDGILNDGIKFLDGSAGTMAYPCSLMKLAYRKISKLIDEDGSCFGTDAEKQVHFNEWFRKSFLRKEEGFGNVFGFEILMSPYILGSIRILMMAEKLGASIDYSTDRVQMYLLNTLMDVKKYMNIEDFLAKLENKEIKNEITEGLKIRSSEDVMVVMSNPPYNIKSQNTSEWITDMVNEYITEENLTREEGKPQIKKIMNLKSSKDDYWKFIRFAQWKVAENGKKQGIVAYITNNYYIDGLTARGMRKELRKSFDEVYVINLHGDWKKSIPSRAPKGLKNGDVFDGDCNCGVAIVFMIRYPKERHDRHKKDDVFACHVKYTELWGDTKEKLDNLKISNIGSMTFEDVGDNHDWEFTPYIESDVDYDTFPYLCDIFRENIQGIVTSHDTLVSHPSKEVLKNVLSKFYEGKFDVDFEEHYYKDRKKVKGRKYSQNGISFKDTSYWNIDKSRRKSSFESAQKSIIEWGYRGFDKRWICYYKPLIIGPRFKLMQYLLPHQNNLAIITNRQSRGKSVEYGSSVFIVNTIFDNVCNEGASGLHSNSFPLKINLSKTKDDFNNPKPAIHSNLNPKFMKQLPYWKWNDLDRNKKSKAITKVFYYIYGILYSPTYRENYKGLLAKDFPRIPFPSDVDTFEEMSIAGKKIASYHLMTDKTTCNIKRQTTNLNDIPLVDGRINIPIKRYMWIANESDPTIGTIYFNTKRKSKKNPGYPNTSDKKKLFWDEPDTSAFRIENVPKEVWEFEIGGMLQLNQWLMARRFNTTPKKYHLTRGINKEELSYFVKIINSITDTLQLLPEIDAVYQKIEVDGHNLISRMG